MNNNTEIINLGEWRPRLPIHLHDWIKTLSDRINAPLIDPRAARVRGPDFHANHDPLIERWHKDNNGNNIWLLIWFSAYPTLLRSATEKTIYKPNLESFHIYAFNNVDWEHKAEYEGNRWFARAYMLQKPELKKG